MSARGVQSFSTEIYTESSRNDDDNNNNKYQEIMTLGNYRKLPYWALRTYFGKC
jgi:hypothetical protein